MSNEGRLNKDIFEKQRNKKGIKFKPNDILFGKLRPYLNKWLHTDFEGIAVGDFWVLRSIGIDSFFIFYLLQTPRFMSIANLSSGTKMPRSDWRIISNSYFTVPNNFHEESKIGRFFNQFAKIIELHQRKINILKQIKKSYFNKMFPELNNNISSMRFRGFTTPWEDKKLNELFIKSGSGGTPRSNVTEYYNGDIPFLSITDITKSDGYIYKTDKKISEKGLENSAACVVPAGSISLAMYASVGKIAILKIDVATSQAFYNMIFDNNLIRDFVYQSLSKANEFDEWNKFISTGTQKNLNAEKVKNFTIKIPPEGLEIHEINQTLINFDTIIKKYKNKLCLLQNLKQQFLNKMFI